MWKDKRQIVSRNGPNCSNDRRGPYTSFGVYKWPWKPWNKGDYPESRTDHRLAYFDEFRLGGSRASYDDVAPEGKPSLPQPSLSLSYGWNKIAWPNIPNYTAKSILEDLNNDCGTNTGQSIAQRDQDFWQDYVSGFGGKNFNLQNSQNYFINVNKDCNWSP